MQTSPIPGCTSVISLLLLGASLPGHRYFPYMHTTDQYLVQDLRGTLSRCLELGLCNFFFCSTLLCELQCLGLSGLPTLFSQLRVTIWVSSASSAAWKLFLSSMLGYLQGYFFYFRLHRDNHIVHPEVQCLKTIIYIFCFLFVLGWHIKPVLVISFWLKVDI